MEGSPHPNLREEEGGPSSPPSKQQRGGYCGRLPAEAQRCHALLVEGQGLSGVEGGGHGDMGPCPDLREKGGVGVTPPLPSSRPTSRARSFRGPWPRWRRARGEEVWLPRCRGERCTRR